MKGIVILFDVEQGFGFIRPNGWDESVFVHISDVHNRETLKVGQSVQFEIENAAKGPRAKSVIPGKVQKSPYFIFSIAAFVIVICSIFYMRHQYPLYGIWAYLIAVNVCTMIFYAYDKIISSTKSVRVPERVLHFLTLAGGTPAALLSQKMFHHKSIKRSFQIQFWVIVVIQLLVLFLWIYYF